MPKTYADIPPNMNPKPTLQPHALLDLGSRAQKALKIERLLGIKPGPNTLKVLEIGTGSGGIAHYFAHHPDIRCQVTAVDVVDQRQVADGYDFRLVDSTLLPFEDASYDIVISNHVIEHVGDEEQQEVHLREIKRVLNPQGTGYLLMPNRWMLVEPHYQLAFLSWLPESLRTPYLRLTGKGEHYDCRPLSKSMLERLMAKTGFTFTNHGAQALQEILAVEQKKVGLSTRLAARLPANWIKRLAGMIPTHIYLIKHPEEGGGLS